MKPKIAKSEETVRVVIDKRIWLAWINNNNDEENMTIRVENVSGTKNLLKCKQYCVLLFVWFDTEYISRGRGQMEKIHEKSELKSE